MFSTLLDACNIRSFQFMFFALDIVASAASAVSMILFPFHLLHIFALEFRVFYVFSSLHFLRLTLWGSKAAVNQQSIALQRRNTVLGKWA